MKRVEKENTLKKLDNDPLTPQKKEPVDLFNFMPEEMKKKVAEGLESYSSESSPESLETSPEFAIGHGKPSHGRYIDAHEECGQHEQTVFEPVLPDQSPDQLPGRFVPDDEECGPNETAVWVPVSGDGVVGNNTELEEEAAMEMVEEFLTSQNATETDELLKKDANKAESAFNVLPSYGKYGYNGNQKVEAHNSAASVSGSLLLVAAAALSTFLL